MSTITLVEPEAREAYLRAVMQTAEGCERPVGEEFDDLLYSASKDVRDFKADVALIQRRVELADQLAELPALESKSLQVKSAVRSMQEQIAELRGPEYQRRLKLLEAEIVSEVRKVEEKIGSYRESAGEFDLGVALAKARQARKRLAETADPALAHELKSLRSDPVGPHDYIYAKGQLQKLVYDQIERRVGYSGYLEDFVLSRGTEHWQARVAGLKSTIGHDKGEFVSRAEEKLPEAESKLAGCLAAEKKIADMDAEYAAATAERDRRIAELEESQVDPHRAAIEFPAA